MSRPVRAGFLLGIFVLATASPARADWLITPFLGTTFAGQTPLPQLGEDGVGARHWLLGGSFGWLGGNIVGFEADVALVPGIFERDNALNLIEASSATTLSGNVILAAPLSVTRESLRPYVVGGIGLTHAMLQEQTGVLGFSLNELAVQLGGGAIGMVSNRTGVRFDIRQSRTLGRADNLLGDRDAKLSFWRATVGVVIRY